MPTRSTTHTPNMDSPSGSEKKSNSRVTLGLLLTFLLPPVGLVYLWREGVFRTRGRMLITALAAVEMTLLLMLILPQNRLIVDLPVPAVPIAATHAPDSGVVNALSNIDQLLAEKQAEEMAAAGLDATPMPTDSAAYLAEQEAILNTTVYSVYGSGARYYHRVEICGTQTNRRQLTVREAMNLGMGACPNCNPPVYGQSSIGADTPENVTELADGAAAPTIAPEDLSERVDTSDLEGLLG